MTFLGYLNFKDVYQVPKLQRSYSVALWLLDRKKRESSKAVNQYPIDYSKGLLYRADRHRLRGFCTLEPVHDYILDKSTAVSSFFDDFDSNSHTINLPD